VRSGSLLCSPQIASLARARTPVPRAFVVTRSRHPAGAEEIPFVSVRGLLYNPEPKVQEGL